MDYYLGDHPLIICSEIENQQRMQVYQYTENPAKLREKT